MRRLQRRWRSPLGSSPFRRTSGTAGGHSSSSVHRSRSRVPAGPLPMAMRRCGWSTTGMTGTQRRILLVGHDGTRVAHEAPFDVEDTLHQALAEHPEVLPAGDLGLGVLVTLASHLQLPTGEVDLLCTDRSGRLAIVEFKKGSENPDTRKVVAQLLDYGAGLWSLTYEELEERCRAAQPGFSTTMAEHVAAQLDALGEDPLDADAYQQAVESALEHGDFAFVYAARDLDDRTRRIATYLAEGPRLAFFAVEVDHFEDAASGGRVLVPRTAFTPSY